ncbi:MAG: aerotolerance regulator BatA, partial [Candidatus Latescibacteria bacterium]|nr:aerotolerance regulator BatA [Candidatus Latescibacterota bacterium]
VGKRGRAPIRVKHPLLGEQIRWLEDSIDEGVLMKVADITGGRFYRATSQDALVNIYEQINALETSEIETQEISRHEELTFRFSLLPIALGVLLLGFVADNTIFRSVP